MTDYDVKCERIIEWAEQRNKNLRGKQRHFDATTIEGILSWIRENDAVTENQAQTIDNIIEKWRIQMDDN